MVTYESTEKVLFSADAFGKFGAIGLTAEEGWACEARRYYFNIVGRYGAAVQRLLQKTETLDIQCVCPLHGPVVRDGLRNYVNLYKIWSSFRPESKGVVIAYASIHGNTAKVAEKLAELLEKKGIRYRLHDLVRADMSQVISDAFRYDKLVLAAASYDGGVFPVMEDFLHHLRSKTFQNRKVALIENGSWQPTAAQTMKDILSNMKELEILEPVITVFSTMKEENEVMLEALAEHLR
jgi:flavorubredoxin